MASTLIEESSPVSGVTSLGSDVTGTGGGSVRTSSIFCALTVLSGGTEAGGMAALVTVFTGVGVPGLGRASPGIGALDGGLLA